MDFQYSEEQKELKQRVRKFAEEKLSPIAAEVDSRDETSWEVVKLLAEEGLFRYLMPEEYDGFGIKPIQLCIIREELARVCVQASDTFVMSELGGYPIVRFGSEEQKKKYLPPLARGEKIASYALTEPNAGSDIASIGTTAILKDGFYVMNGRKCFATNAGAAEVCTVYAKTDPEMGSKGISAFIIDTSNKQPGLSCQAMKLIGPGAEYEIMFEDYHIPKENLLGEQGKGMRIALTSLDLCRTTVGAHAVGLAQAAYEEALKYAHQRKAFGQPLIEFQATQFKLADMVTNIEAARLLVYKAASMTSLGDEEKIIGRASMAKLFATEMAQHVADEALQIHGGIGLIRGSRMERLYRAVRLPRIYEGTSEIQRITIARAIRRGELDE
jgi:alkylation response protein AidB-like acyl-CoA dehydrogenase